jgi:two-component system cell cycle response regulator DivK
MAMVNEHNVFYKYMFGSRQTKEGHFMGSNILYIEDNQDNLRLIKRILESRGYTLLCALDGLTGVSMAENEDVDLVLLDMNLCDIDGYEVARRIRNSNKRESLSHLPIIALTADAFDGDDKKAISAGCTGYMSKPIDLDEFWNYVETYCLPDQSHSSGFKF